MGHGSDVASLLTTATFDEDKDQFIINNSHDIKAIKFWPGDMGIYCTHALVYAQMIIKGKNHGVQPFIVPVRD
jgi:acyl-CoA oxidase